MRCQTNGKNVDVCVRKVFKFCGMWLKSLMKWKFWKTLCKKIHFVENFWIKISAVTYINGSMENIQKLNISVNSSAKL